ncbi:hydrogenase maturation nickel metallochaperone HypA [bacterium]|nr:hydrogenase maturation nickel metallochaperone HypA [bacterium]
MLDVREPEYTIPGQDMHELGLIEEIFTIVQGELDRQGIRQQVECLTLTVGKLSGASPEALQNAFELVSPGTQLEGARLEIEEPGPLCRCPACGFEEEVSQFILSCPACDSGSILLEGGADLRVRSLDVEDDDEGEE